MLMLLSSVVKTRLSCVPSPENPIAIVAFASSNRSCVNTIKSAREQLETHTSEVRRRTKLPTKQ